ncbi:MAG: N-succinylarginine dihydrolase [Planctomycetes bacterium]|nr:N-succinylarginine dihydrolase [Planctomycetota bacterium]
MELQLDGLPGPTNIHGGLSPGNLASQANAGAKAHPRAAARQCLAKMRAVMALGVPQAVLPPLERPDISFLRAAGFAGTDAEVLVAASREDAQLVRHASSSAFMWTANCATVIPAADSADHFCHLVPANLTSLPHRSIEAGPRTRMLRHLFADGERFVVHDPLPAVSVLADEGAANHHRVQGPAGACHLFVHGRTTASAAADLPQRFPARQWQEASAAVARLGRARAIVHARQHPAAIDAGAFHNDVVMAGVADRILVHERALVDQPQVIAELERRCGTLRLAEISELELSLEQAVRSYLFNSQMLDTPTGIVLLAPAESADGPARAVIDRLKSEGFFARTEFIDLRESMMGGGGPACLRLRVPLDESGLAAVAGGIILDEDKLRRLEQWVDRRYRRDLALSDLRDPALIGECRTALDELTRILDLGKLYRFQGGSV